uniref:Putative tail protein n=1 Tax=viral metagenome TaxID=1070528 RepID=A0A6M3J7E6_9ZZZZ
MIIRNLLTKFGFNVDSAKLAEFDKSVDRVKGNLTLATGVLAGMAAAATGLAYAFKGAFLDVSVQFEKFQTILETTEGSQQAAKKAMDWVADFAASTPYELAQVTDAFVKLRSYGMDPTDGLLRTLGDTAAAMGKDVMSAVEAVADAAMGESERLKEFGIKAAKTGATIAYTYTDKAGKQRVAKAKATSKDEIQATLAAIWNEKYGGSMDRLSRTWGGMMSNVGDQWTKFAKMVMDEGPFDFLKGELSNILGGIDDAATSGEMKAAAKKLGKKITEILKVTVKAIKDLVRWGRELYATINPMIQRMGGWEVTLKRIGTALLVAFAVSTLRNVLLMGQAFIVAAKSLAVLAVSAIPMYLWAAAILAIALAVQDLWVYAQGGDSAIGRFFEHFKGQEGIIGGIVRKIIKLQDGLSALMDVNLGEQRVRIIPDDEGTTWLWEIQQMPGRIKDAFIEFGEWLGTWAVRAWIGLRDSAIDAFDAISAAIRSALGSALTWASDRVGDLASALGSLRGALGIGSAAPSPSSGISLPSIPIPAPSAGSSMSQSSTVDVGGISVSVAGSNASPESIGEAVADAIGGVVRRARLGFAGGDA